MNPIISLTLTDRQIALDFGKRHAPSKSDLVCFNTLAVLAVYHHLQSLNVAANLDRSDSWDAILQAFSDIADLSIEGKGAIECRPLLPDAVTCRIPYEVREERLGFVAVRLNSSLSEAELLGFLERVEEEGEEIALDRFAPLESLWEVLERPPVANLLQWLDGVFEAGWEMLEDLVVPEVGFAFRGSGARTIVNGGKLLNINGDRFLLSAILRPEGKGEWDAAIALQSRDAPCLPEGLQLFLRDREDNILMQVEARKSEALRLEFGVAEGEAFSVGIKWHNWEITEQFILDGEISAA
ncbi:MAG: DUF1822 family protein [Cyanobacteria bacterium P01_E01_bin.42]